MPYAVSRRSCCPTPKCCLTKMWALVSTPPMKRRLWRAPRRPFDRVLAHPRATFISGPEVTRPAGMSEKMYVCACAVVLVCVRAWSRTQVCVCVCVVKNREQEERDSYIFDSILFLFFFFFFILSSRFLDWNWRENRRHSTLNGFDLDFWVGFCLMIIIMMMMMMIEPP